MSAATKARIFDAMFSAIGKRGRRVAESGQGPDREHARTSAKEKNVALVSRAIGDSRRSSRVVISIANRQPNSSTRNRPGSTTGWVLGITMRSNGSSKIIGATIAPINPLASLVRQR